MLKEKDYCDYETCVALRGLGYNAPQRLIPDYFGVFEEPQYDERIHLYDAQKWLREEKNIDISVTISPFEYFATIREFVFWQGEYSWEKTIHPNGGKTYEEALSEGIKEAVNILKEE